VTGDVIKLTSSDADDSSAPVSSSGSTTLRHDVSEGRLGNHRMIVEILPHL
jgi:hypothetical protein